MRRESWPTSTSAMGCPIRCAEDRRRHRRSPVRCRPPPCASGPKTKPRSPPAASRSATGSRPGLRRARGRGRAVREAIARGDVYQVNLVQHLSASFSGDPASLAEKLAPLRPLYPRPFVGDGWAIVSASPELFLARGGDACGRCRSRAPVLQVARSHGVGQGRGRARDDRRPRAERPFPRLRDGPVTWPELMSPRPLAGVEHLVSPRQGHAP